MKKEPYKIEGTTDWALNFVDPYGASERVALENLPGARIDEERGRVVGKVDAVAAAAFRLERPVPPKPEAKGVSVADPTLHKYQARGVALALDIQSQRAGVLIADDVGLGKTREASKTAQLRSGRTLVLCPASVRETWREELARIGAKKVSVLGPPSNKRYLEEWAKSERADVVVTSYELARDAFDYAFASSMPRSLILDEIHILKSRRKNTLQGNESRLKTIESIAAMCDFKIGLTATPMWSRPRDLYSLLRILFGTAFGSAFEFDIAYCGGRPGEFGGVVNDGISRADELRLRLSYLMVRRTRGEVMSELPAMTRQVRWLDETAHATAAFTASFINKNQGATLDALRAAAEGKINAVVAFATEVGERFLVTTWMREHAERISALLDEAGVANYVVHGGVPHGKRAEIIRAAAASGAGIVATLDSIGTGVDGLQYVAHHGIAHGFDWVPLKLIQTEGRLDRQGQSLPVQWTYFAMRGSMDERVVQVAVSKLDQFRQAVKGSEPQRAMRDQFSDALSSPEAQDAALKSLYAAM